MKNKNITVVILTFNEEIHIERCIRSALGITDNIIVIDSYSTDDTLKILKKYKIKVHQNKFIHQAAQINYALKNIKIKTKWIFRLDADEIIEKKFIKDFDKNLNFVKSDISGLDVNKNLIFMGKAINFGGIYPQKVVRIWRNGEGKYIDTWMDEHVVLKNKKSFINVFIADHNLNNFSWWVKKHKQYARREAIDYLIHKNQKNYYYKKSKKIYYQFPMLIRPVMYFFYRYFFKFGFLNSWQGLIFDLFQGFYYRFCVDICIGKITIFSHVKKISLKKAIKILYGYHL
jgi:glycosyltransferase involved in cell wall biosynthesis